MGPPGLEPQSVTCSNDKHLREAGNESAAESGAVHRQTGPEDPDLARIIDAWPDLPEAVRVGIMAMVQAAGPDA